MENQKDKLVVFQSKDIRRIWHVDEWFYSVVDICGALTESKNPRDYWYRIKKNVQMMKSKLSCRQFVDN